jgi:hypothetical protein
MFRTLVIPTLVLSIAARAAGAELVDLGTFGGRTSQAHAIEGGRAVGSAEDIWGATRPFLWTAEEGLQSLGSLEGRRARGGDREALRPEAPQDEELVAEVGSRREELRSSGVWSRSPQRVLGGGQTC